ncbi:hypothetical protein [Halobacillus karajensis]|uniref:hypothetical protein n=1 Tax=Halobacillus karajensis TaxID=195088 RepID=UPI00069050C7
MWLTQNGEQHSWAFTGSGKDSGYAFGTLIAGVIADIINVNWAIGLVAVLPFLSGIITWSKMKEMPPILLQSK